jgi:large subunit ribosomal protein L32e
MAKSPHHEDFMKLHLFKEEYIQELEALGIKSPEELADALKSEDTVKLILSQLKGVGPKTIEHWCEDLGVKEEEPEKAAATKTRKVKAEKTEKKPKEEKKAKAEKDKEEAEEKEEEVAIEEEGGYQVKLKPTLSDDLADALRKRGEISGRRPEFLRQEWYKRTRLQQHRWRRPRGGHSKMRQHYAYRRNVVSIGFGGPRAARHLHPSGFREVMVHNVRDVERLDPKTQAARIAHKVGMRKRIDIEKKADELKIRVLNRSG